MWQQMTLITKSALCACLSIPLNVIALSLGESAFKAGFALVVFFWPGMLAGDYFAKSSSGLALPAIFIVQYLYFFSIILILLFIKSLSKSRENAHDSA